MEIDQATEQQGDKRIHQEPTGAACAARTEVGDEFENRSHQNNYAKEKRQRSETEQGMREKVKSAGEVQDSEQHLPDYAPCSASAERRDQMRPATEQEQLSDQDGYRETRHARFNDGHDTENDECHCHGNVPAAGFLNKTLRSA
jgi:hypothetical protein